MDAASDGEDEGLAPPGRYVLARAESEDDQEDGVGDEGADGAEEDGNAGGGVFPNLGGGPLVDSFPPGTTGGGDCVGARRGLTAGIHHHRGGVLVVRVGPAELDARMRGDQSGVGTSEREATEAAILDSSRLFVRNLSYGASEAELAELFGRVGDLEEVHLVLDRCGGGGGGGRGARSRQRRAKAGDACGVQGV